MGAHGAESGKGGMLGIRISCEEQADRLPPS
jgi:hypothetical protein